MYLKLLPKGYKLPEPDEDLEAMRTFIQNKYVSLKWADQSVREERLAAAKKRAIARRTPRHSKRPSAMAHLSSDRVVVAKK